MKKSLIQLAKYGIENNSTRIRMLPFVENENDYPTDDEISGPHHIGGTRMSISRQMGVVDKNCKVFGLNNFYIMGSSVFPTGGHANPTLTIVQLSLRLSEFITKSSDNF